MSPEPGASSRPPLTRSRNGFAGPSASSANSGYAALLDAEVRRQRLIQELVEVRKANGLTQATVAQLMHVRQSVVAEIESAKADIRFSTLDRYAGAVSRHKLHLELVE